MLRAEEWFSSAERAGLVDFWQVYDRHYDAVNDVLLAYAERDPEFAPLVAASTPETRRVQQAESRERTKRALHGDWSAYEEGLSVQGAVYAKLGIGYTTWFRLLRVVARELTPRLVEEYAADGARLSDAIGAMHSFFDFAMAAIGESYLAAKQAAIQKGQEELACSQSRFQKLADSGAVSVVVSDKDGRFVDANDRFLTMLGYSRDQLVRGEVRWVGMTPLGWEHADDVARQQLAETGAFQTYEKEFFRKDGSRVPILIGGATIGADQVISVVVDVTKQKELEDVRARSMKLEVENRRIQEATRLKSEFLANMSHELRTPLNAIIGFAELLFDDEVRPDMPQYKEFLGDILTSGRHLLKLINDVLDLSKVEAGKFEFHPDDVDPGMVMSEVIAIVRTAAASKQIRVEHEVDPALGKVFIDASRLKQVLYNYVSNALKFTPDRGRVVMRAKVDGANAFRIEVEDTGVGIAPHDIARLFTEFQQLDAGAAKTHAGTGLGLALTKRLVEAQGGSVGVRSVPGEGSVFHVVLPRRAPKGVSMPVPRVVAGARPGARAILVIEDNENDQNAIVRTLSEAGYAVETASTGAQALAKCRERSFDAITLDLLLPDASGLEVLRALRETPLNRDVPVVVITVVTEIGSVGGFAVHDMFGKPLEGTSLLASLRRAGVSPERTGTVLVIDDDPSSLKLMSATLGQLGYRGTTALRAADGLALAEKSTPLAVILDLMMPEMDGFEFLEQFRKLPQCRRVPVVIWSVKDLSSDEYARLHRSAQGFLQKGRDVGATMVDELRVFLPSAGADAGDA